MSVGMADREAQVARGLTDALSDIARAGMPRLEAHGQLIRPLLVFAGSLSGESPGRRLWFAAAAVQYAHEASLVHDDIIDGAKQRRGAETMHVREGMAGALVHGDHLLTAAYRTAAEVNSIPFMRAFARAVERTVAGEIDQNRRAGEWLDEPTYEAIVAGKSGELIGVALATAHLLREDARAEQVYSLGIRLGVLYQRIDDLLDYLPSAATGKPALADYMQQKWTWPLGELEVRSFAAPAKEVAAALFIHDQRGLPILRCLKRVEQEAAALVSEIDAATPNNNCVAALISGWLQKLRREVIAALRQDSTDRSGSLQWLMANAPDRDTWPTYFAQNSKSFRFAARWFSGSNSARVSALYAFCRFTDDLADTEREAHAPKRESLLDAWQLALHDAYQGSSCGIDLLDRITSDMRAAGVPLQYADELIEGMRMDLRNERYTDYGELRVYTYRVAGVIGQWMTRLFGVDDPWTLEHAAEMGHAMQLTNIVRDVLEDWGRGRLYLPAELMSKHDVTEHDIERSAATGAVTQQFRSLLEELMREADRSYDFARVALPRLPAEFARAAAVASQVYRGIHDEVRRNRYDLRRRAATTIARKFVLGLKGIRALRPA